MQRFWVAVTLLVTLSVLAGCGGGDGGVPTRVVSTRPPQPSSTAALTPTPELTPTPDAIATSEAALAATIEALRSRGSTATPIPTSTPAPTPLPPTRTPTPAPPLQSPTPTPTPVPQLVAMAERVRPSVVRIDSELATGSGVIIEVDTLASALVLTNHHVIEGARDVQVLVDDTTTYSAVIVGTDPLRDLALLRICCSIGFRAVPFGDASAIRSGAEVIAIGYAFGIEGEATVSRGIVSATRDLSTTIDDNPFEGRVLQTDAAINSGNSSGPLLTGSGEIIGINTFGIPSAEGLGFAISQETISAVLPDLRAGSQITIPPDILGVPSSPYTSDAYWYTIQVPRGWTIDHSEDFIADAKPVSRVVMWYSELSADFSMDVQISFEEIDPDLYQDLDSYVAARLPRLGEISHERIRVALPVQAERYHTEGSVARVVEDVYILGRYLATVRTAATPEVWEQDQYAEIRQQLELALGGFQPSTFVSTEHGYSVSHPTAWQTLPSGIADYWKEDIGAQRRVFVQVLSAEGFTDVATYADAAERVTGVTLRQRVFTDRPNPSYRIEYSNFSSNLGKFVTGVALVTLSGTDAIWLFVEGPRADWMATKPFADDVLLRFAAKP